MRAYTVKKPTIRPRSLRITTPKTVISCRLWNLIYNISRAEARYNMETARPPVAYISIDTLEHGHVSRYLPPLIPSSYPAHGLNSITTWFTPTIQNWPPKMLMKHNVFFSQPQFSPRLETWILVGIKGGRYLRLSTCIKLLHGAHHTGVRAYTIKKKRSSDRDPCESQPQKL